MLDKKKLYNLTLVFSPDSLDSQVEVFDLIHDDQESYQLFKEWHAYFVARNFSLDLITQHFDTYWKWYVMVTWKNFAFHNEEILATVVPYQFMMAFRLEYDVFKLYPNHVVSFIPEDSVQDTLHASIVDQITNSTLPFDYQKGKSIAALIRDIKNAAALDEFDRSEIYANIERFLFVGDDSSSSEEKLERMSKFFNFINFVTDKKAMGIFRDLYTQSANYLPSSLIGSVYSEITAGTSAGEGEVDSFLTENKNTEKDNIFVTIRDQISNGLKNNTDDVDEYILGELQKFSEQYREPRILDLYYFDEEAGEFRWNDDLLKK